jgi:uncharacterized protein YegL
MTEKSRRTLLVIFAVSLVASLLGCQKGPNPRQKGMSVSYQKASQEVQLKAWGAELPTDIVLLLDQSGSMSKGKHPTDPQGLRAQGSQSFVEFVAQRSDKEHPNRFGVVNFGSHAPRVHALPLTPIRTADDPALRSVFDKLTLLELGDTSFIEAMQLGMQLLRESGSFEEERNRALVIFTDGEPDDARKLTIEQYFSELAQFIERDVKPAKVDVFVVGIDALGARWSATVPLWRQLVGEDHVFTAPTMDALKSLFNRIVQRIWHLPQVEPEVVYSGRSVEFEVEPYLAAVEFHIFPSRQGLALKITRPDGKAVQPGKDPDTPPVKRLAMGDLLVVYDPEPGRWRYEVVGGTGRVEVLRNPIPIRMKLISPAPVHPQGKPMRLIAEFKRADGKPVPSYRDYPLALAGEITTPSGKRTPVKFPLERGKNGVYVGEPALEAPMETGEYRILLKVLGGERYRAEYPVRVQVEPIPYLLVDEPREGVSIAPSPAVSVRARLLKAGKPVRPQDEFTNHPDYLVIAQVIESPDGKKGEAVWLRCAEEVEQPNTFFGQVPTASKLEGNYTLALRLAPEEVAKQSVADVTVIEFVSRSPLWKNPLLWVYIILLAALGVCGVLWWVNAPRLIIHYWASNQNRQNTKVSRRNGETIELPGVPLVVKRRGKSDRAHYYPHPRCETLQAGSNRCWRDRGC